LRPQRTYNKLLILGAAESGVGAALLAKAKGYDVFVSDNGKISDDSKNELVENNIQYEEGGHKNISGYKIAIISPGIPDKAPIVKQLEADGVELISEIEFAADHTNSTLVAITGTNGKTTTTTLIHHILTRGGLDASLVGNIGKSFARQIAERDTAFYVIEVSSFQLDRCYRFNPHVAVLTNISNNHLDRYDYSLEKYAAAKFRLVQNQTSNDYFIYNIDDDGINKYFPNNVNSTLLPISFYQVVEQGAYVENDTIHFKFKHHHHTMNLFNLALQGKHNAYNSMAAGIAAQVLELRNETVRESLADFKSLEHRLEFVTNTRGVDFINDSKATNVNSVWYALESMNKPVIWIAGGIDKGNDYSQIVDLVKNRVKTIICLGKDNSKIHSAFANAVDLIVNTESMRDAVHSAMHFAETGYAVLLSPACASFDLFNDFEDRGRQFKACVREL
jgi:UDP-N-acetylmuramoylalanine--D-glutamate ligase